MSIFTQISLVIILATAAAIIARMLKQPSLVAYIIVGVIISIFGFNFISSNETALQSLGSIGIAFLLFIVGLELNFSKLKKLGNIVVGIAFFQIIITFALGFLLSRAFNYSAISSIYLALALTFGSTIIVVKLLSEQKMLDHLFGRITLGVLLIQDLVAIVGLVFLETLDKGAGSDYLLMTGIVIFKIIALIFVIWAVGHYFINFILRKVAAYPELLFLTAISWCFAAAVFANLMQVSIEVGAFLAGISIASGLYSMEISVKVKSLRDFFTIIFFVLLGIQFDPQIFGNINQIIVLTLFVLIIHPLVILIIMGFYGFRRRTSFLVGISLAQISEFSLIFIIVGQRLGHISQDIVSVLIAVIILTVCISSYLIIYAKPIFHAMQSYLGIFERKHTRYDQYSKQARAYYDHVILLGARRTGFNILQTLIKLKEQIVVVDINPELVEELMDSNIQTIYGDVTDPEILDNLNITEAKMVISTIPEFADNLAIIKKVKTINLKVIVYVTAFNVDEALELYKEGADYVILPHHISADHVSFLLKEYKTSYAKILKRRLSHMQSLEHHYAKHGNRH